MDEHEEVIDYRITSRYWLTRVVPAVLFLLVVPLILAILISFGYAILFIIGFIVFAIFFRTEITQAPDNPVRIMNNAISFSPKGDQVVVPWSELKYMEVIRYGAGRRIILHTDQDIYTIPGIYYDFESLLVRLTSHLPAEVLDPLAYRSQDQFVRWKEDRDQYYSEHNRILKVDIGQTGRFVGLLFLFFGLFFAYQKVYTGNPNRLALVVLSAAGIITGCFLLLMSRKWLACNNEKIILRTTFHLYEICWADIKRMVKNPNTNQYVIYDNLTCMVIPSEVFWSGKDRRAMHHMIDYKIHSLPMPPQENYRTFLLRTKYLR